MKTKRNKRQKRNPLLLTLSNPATTAAAAFQQFHRTEPKAIRRIDGPDLVALGDLVEIVYRPTRGARRGPAFVHRFGPGAIVAATVDGEKLVLVPNPKQPFRVDWTQGIVG